mmetsp:Transcript_6318/g.14425  ORF Transcript_6318/g.14425 Transcript_6318/m.14425 type:complete len:401 (-) Transcript_6318:3680-4882(-)
MNISTIFPLQNSSVKASLHRVGQRDRSGFRAADHRRFIIRLLLALNQRWQRGCDNWRHRWHRDACWLERRKSCDSSWLWHCRCGEFDCSLWHLRCCEFHRLDGWGLWRRHNQRCHRCRCFSHRSRCDSCQRRCSCHHRRFSHRSRCKSCHRWRFSCWRSSKLDGFRRDELCGRSGMDGRNGHNRCNHWSNHRLRGRCHHDGGVVGASRSAGSSPNCGCSSYGSTSSSCHRVGDFILVYSQGYILRGRIHLGARCPAQSRLALRIPLVHNIAHGTSLARFESLPVFAAALRVQHLNLLMQRLHHAALANAILILLELVVARRRFMDIAGAGMMRDCCAQARWHARLSCAVVPTGFEVVLDLGNIHLTFSASSACVGPHGQWSISTLDLQSRSMRIGAGKRT